ncbi:hypothetical protein M0R45_036149 [Rubus argutus]|uniref:Uncharacterized protein n=1 Tax=Rubus argutus TaxID=59490 RepID=A0AAW1VV81_RUBAR
MHTRICETNMNPNRPYWRCGKRDAAGRQCPFMIWVDEHGTMIRPQKSIEFRVRWGKMGGLTGVGCYLTSNYRPLYVSARRVEFIGVTNCVGFAWEDELSSLQLVVPARRVVDPPPQYIPEWSSEKDNYEFWQGRYELGLDRAFRNLFYQ